MQYDHDLASNRIIRFSSWCFFLVPPPTACHFLRLRMLSISPKIMKPTSRLWTRKCQISYIARYYYGQNGNEHSCFKTRREITRKGTTRPLKMSGHVTHVNGNSLAVQECKPMGNDSKAGIEIFWGKYSGPRSRSREMANPL